MKRTSFRPDKTVFGLLIALSSLTACANLQRSAQSGYSQYDDRVAGGDRPNFGRDRSILERTTARQELNRSFGEAGSDNLEEAVSIRLILKKAEQALEGRREREQYFTNKPYMRDDRERLEFLRLESYDDRERWMKAKGIGAASGRYPAATQALIDVNDIAVGFTKQAVRDSWGEPELVEVSGNPIYGNERWHYSEQTSSTEGYRSQRRIVFFKDGRVQGWESN